MEHIDPSRAVWDALSFGAPLQQSWSYGEVARALGARVERYAVGPASDPEAVIQVIRRFGIGYASVGWHSRTASAAPAVRLPGLTLIAGPGGVPVSDGREVAVRTLDGDLRAGMAQKWRNRLNFAERAGLGVRRIVGCPQWLLEEEAEQRAARRYKTLPAAWLRQMERSDPRAVRTYAAYVGPRPVAGVCILRHSGRWTYHLGWTGPEGRKRSAHHLLIARAMEDAMASGAMAFDLGLIDPANQGLRRFKLGTGAAALTVPGMGLRVGLSGKARRRASVPAYREA